MRTEEIKKKHRDYMREYNKKNKKVINARRVQRRLERIEAGEDVREISRRANQIYHEKHKEKIRVRAKAKNWYYSPEKGKVKREKFRDAHPGRNTLRARKAYAKRKGITFNLTEEWYVGEWDKGCALTAIPFASSGEKSPWIAHIDRIVPEKGYIESNCRLVCACYNFAKSNWTDEDVLKMAKALVEQ